MCWVSTIRIELLTWRQELSAAVRESTESSQMQWEHTMNPSSEKQHNHIDLSSINKISLLPTNGRALLLIVQNLFICISCITDITFLLWKGLNMQLFHDMLSWNSCWKREDRLTYLAVSALLVMRVLMRSSCPYRAAMCSGVFPFLSSQSISAPLEKETN